ncbi:MULTISPECIES: TonB-dependent receptor [Sphingobacterium]|uniref:TonB-dependent receptor n=1 Tax=Sphingobacterium TaxID=28453 RepID=UPI0013D8F72B|nr:MULTISPECIES: TonB-dependent receptor [unclassified Sphingobacterium]
MIYSTAIITTLLVLCTALGIYAQSGLQGSVLNSYNQPISKTSVTVLSQTTGESYQTYSDNQGLFRIDLPKGKYLLDIYHMGYQRHKVLVDVLPRICTVLGTVQLVTESQQLEEITVQGTRRLIEHKNDRTVINVENSILATGATALELLKRAPSLRVDEADNIHMRGKSDIGIMINGKLSYLSDKELTNMLKSMPSESIKSIELISSPSAKFDAQGVAGMINIVMKQSPSQSMSGNVHTFGGAGRKERYGLGATLGGQRDRWRWQGAMEYAYRGEEEYRNFDRFYTGIEGGKSLQYAITDEPLRTQQARAGLEYVPTDRTSIGVLWTGNFGVYKSASKGYNDVYALTGDRTVHTLTDNTNDSRWQTHNVGFNLIQKIGKKSELSADWDILYSTYKADQVLRSSIQKYKNGNSQVEARRNATPSTTGLQVAKVDYQYRWNASLTAEVGGKSSWVKSDNNSLSDTLKTEQWVADLQNSNHFVYKEQIHAAYANFNLSFDQWGINAGVRTEHTKADGVLKTDGTTLNKDYINFFPTVSVRYEMNDKNQVQLSYSRRINRPDYEDLNPFRYYVDAYVYWEGNPLLQPELANAYELKYSFNRDLLFSFYYTDVKDVMTSVLTQLPNENKTIRSVHNIKGFQNYGVNMDYSFLLMPFWSTQWNVNAFENNYFGSFGEEQIANRLWSYTVQTNHNYRLPKRWSAEWTAAYESPQTDGVFRQKASGYVSLGLMKKMLDDKLNLKLAVDDIFKTSLYRTTSSVANVDMDQRIDLDSRIWRISINYSFGKNRNDRKMKDNEQQQRVRGM